MYKKIAYTKAGQNSRINFNNTSADNQQIIILRALRDSPKTTIELRQDYGVMMPAARVKELREQGCRIDTVRITCLSPDGIEHKKVARYVLLGGSHDE